MPQASTTAHAVPYEAGGRRTARSHVSPAIWSSIARLPSTLLARYREWQRVQRAISELSDLSDRMLADMGIRRADIPRLARQGRDVTEIGR